MNVLMFTQPFFLLMEIFTMFYYFTKSSMEIIFFIPQKDKGFEIKILHEDETYY